MSMKFLRAAQVAVIGAGLAISATGTATAQSENTCVAYRDIETIRGAKNDDMTAVVTTRRHDYLVTFLARCPVRAIGGSFGLDRNRLGPCVRPGDLYYASEPVGSCTVVSIGEAQDRRSLRP